jgi:hypothetical protein
VCGEVERNRSDPRAVLTRVCIFCRAPSPEPQERHLIMLAVSTSRATVRGECTNERRSCCVPAHPPSRHLTLLLRRPASRYIPPELSVLSTILDVPRMCVGGVSCWVSLGLASLLLTTQSDDILSSQKRPMVCLCWCAGACRCRSRALSCDVSISSPQSCHACLF